MFRHFLCSALVLLLACLLEVGAVAQAQAQDDEPIAYIGHGAFFDRTGKQIQPTMDFVARAQEWYRKKLLADLSEEKKAEFAKVDEQLNAETKAEGQARLVVQQQMLDWLAANSPVVSKDGRTLGKLNALSYALQWKLPTQVEEGLVERQEEFKLDPELQKILDLPEFKPGGLSVLSATINQGQAYINECIANGVPIPPSIGIMDPAGTNGWRSLGFIPQNEQFIVGTPAEVRVYGSTSPEGMCVALPRYTDASRTMVALDGVICLGRISSNVCFWDNQMNGKGFNFPSGTVIPIGVPDLATNPAGQYQSGGFELNNGSGGVCTDCHAGQNPYIIHPNADLGGGLVMGDLNQPPLNLPTFSTSRYDPLVPASWPQNQLSHSPALVPGVCSGCHNAGGSGGAFPHLSTELPSYCNTVLAQAIAKTMPPSSPGSQAGNAAVTAFRNTWCGTSASSGPSNRGDPHLTTTNAINYDFQAAGEFTALRNSATGFELQNRQTPVSTATIPDANPYTGLPSCVSVTTAVALRMGKYRITYQPGLGPKEEGQRPQLRIDGELVTPPKEGIDFGGGNVIRRADRNGGLDISAQDGTRVLVTPNYWPAQNTWYMNIDVVHTPAREGTMGHIPAGDWLPLAPDGASFGPAPASLIDRHFLLNSKFADAWRVDTTTTLFDYALGTSTDTFTDRQWPPEPGATCIVSGSTKPIAEPMNPERAAGMCRMIKDDTVYANCVYDLTVTGNIGMLKAYLRSLQLKQNAAAMP